MFLKKRNELKTKDIGFCVAAVALMIIPAVGSVYPVPAAPANYFPYIFLAYLLCGFVRGGIMAGKPASAARVREVSQEIEDQHVGPGVARPA